MPRTTGTYRVTTAGNEEVRAFVPVPLPPANPPLALDESLMALHAEAVAAVGKLSVAGAMVPSPQWFIYGFVRKEAVVSSEIEGTQATLQDVVTYEATKQAERPDDVREVCNYVDALTYARAEIAKPKGLPLSSRLLCEAHKRLMRGVRGADKQPGEIRRSQNWIGGTRPGNARFVPPPPEDVPALMAQLDKWLHSDDTLPPLVKAGLAHVQFETIHPFLDGNGRLGRLLITLYLCEQGILDEPLLYLSLYLKSHRATYYALLQEVREHGRWETWLEFFLTGVRDVARQAHEAARSISAIFAEDAAQIAGLGRGAPAAQALHALLQKRPLLTIGTAAELSGVTFPTATAALERLQALGIVEEITGKARGRVFVYQRYLSLLEAGTEPL